MNAPAEILPLPHGPTRVRWRRSARALRVSLRIDAGGEAVVVTLPPGAARAAGLDLLSDHAAWVADRLAALPAAVIFRDGGEVPVAGRPTRIRHLPQEDGAARLEADEVRVGGRSEDIARRITVFLRGEARRVFAALVTEKAALAAVVPRRVVVKDTRSRWGSCAPDGTLMFCWRLAMAPRFVQDYVAAHEVAHLRHMDHGRRFWTLVERLTPHRAAGIAWLQEDGARLLRTGAPPL